MIKKIFFTFATFLFLGQNSFAAKNNLQMTNTLSDTTGAAFGNSLERQSVGTFIEKPISPKMSFGASTQVSRTDSKTMDYRDAYAINFVEIFNRYKIFSYKKLGVTVQNAVKLPGLYNENQYLGLMNQQLDYELRFLFAFNMPDRLVNTVTRNETPFFARAEVAYRRRFSNPFDEARFTFWSGARINQNFSLLFQDNITWNLVRSATATDNSNTNFATFDVSKDANNNATLSLMYHLNKDTALQFGYTKRLSGNAPFYNNHGLLVGLWNSF